MEQPVNQPSIDDESDRYTQPPQATEQDKGDTSSSHTHEATPALENPDISAHFGAMVEGINADLSQLYQEINQHINDQLENIKVSQQDVTELINHLKQEVHQAKK